MAKGRTRKGNVRASTRHKTATIRKGGKDKYPIFDKKSAKSALKLINNAKPPLTAAEKAKVRRKANRYLKKKKKKR